MTQSMHLHFFPGLTDPFNLSVLCAFNTICYAYICIYIDQILVTLTIFLPFPSGNFCC